MYVRTYHTVCGVRVFLDGAWSSWRLQVVCLHLTVWTVCSVPFFFLVSERIAGELTYRSTAPGGGLGPRSLVLHLAQHRLAYGRRAGRCHHDDHPLCGHCAIDPFVKTREPPSPLGTRVGCKPTGVTQKVVV